MRGGAALTRVHCWAVDVAVDGTIQMELRAVESVEGFKSNSNDLPSVILAVSPKLARSPRRANEKRVSDANKAIGRCPGESDRDVEVDLVPERQFVSSSKVDQMPRAALLREIASVLDECVPRFGYLPVEKECRLARECVLAGERGPVRRHLPPALQFPETL